MGEMLVELNLTKIAQFTASMNYEIKDVPDCPAKDKVKRSLNRLTDYLNEKMKIAKIYNNKDEYDLDKLADKPDGSGLRNVGL